ncbi:radical SAM protein [Paenibacillaceae bacterium]|nr:radical SAM protein [Paenibacillaceae bacterium]
MKYKKKLEVIMSKKLKSSKFNVEVYDKEGNLLIFNTLTGNKTKIGSTSAARVAKLLREPQSSLSSELDKDFFISQKFIIDEQTDEYEVASELHRNTINAHRTLTLILLPTENCNFRCKYCYESFEKNWMTENVRNAVVEYVAKNISNYDSIHFEWFGGEPLTAYPVIEAISERVINICRKNKVRYTASMTTNGYLLNLDMFRKLQKLRVVKYQISLDGAKEFHDSQRVLFGGQGSFEKIFRNLKAIKDNITSSSFLINVRSNISAGMLDSLDTFSGFLATNFSNDKRFNFFWKTVGDWGGDSVKNMNLCTLEDLLPQIGENIKKGLDFRPFTNVIYPGESVCYAAKKNNFVIGSDGIVYKCTVAFNMEENQIGQLNDDGSMTINEERLKLWVTGHEESDSNCQKCFFRPSCQGATCPLSRIQTSKSPCPPQKSNIKTYVEYQFETV